MLFAVFVTGCTNDSTGDTKTTTTGNTIADINDDPEKVVIYFFWGDGCPHCATQKPFLEELENTYPEVEVKMFETWNNPQNAKLFQEVAQAYDTSAQGVPTTFIGEEHWVGYADYMGSEMEAKINECIENGCINPGDKLN